jgi:Na+/proline symporter
MLALAQTMPSPSTLQLSTLKPLDWAVLAGYLLLLAGAGWWWARRAARSEADYFYASRSIPPWAIAISLIATAQSAATFLGVPSAAYAGSYSYILGNLSYIVGGVLASVLFLRHYHAMRVRSPYELVRAAAGRPAMLACVWAFVVGKLLGAGARTYIGALPLSLAVFGDVSLPHVSVCVVCIMVFAVAFTLVGGVRSVIWTDLLQVVVYMGAAVLAIVLLYRAINLPVAEIASTLRSAQSTSGVSKLTVLDWGFTPQGGIAWGNQFSLLTAFSGAMLLSIAVLVSDQDVVQRALACPTPRDAVRSTILAQLLGIPVVLVFLTIGMLLFVYYTRVAPGGAPAAKDVFQTYIFTQMPAGVRGLMIAGVLAIGPIGINATLNSLASVVSAELLPAGRELPAESATRRARWLVVLVGVVLLVVSLFAAWYQQASTLPLIDFALNSLSFTFAPLLAIFVCVVLLRRGSAWSIMLALASGFGTCVLLQRPVLSWLHTKVGLNHAGLSQPGSLDAVFAWASSLAFPWHFVFACAIALCVCACGSQPTARGARR